MCVCVFVCVCVCVAVCEWLSEAAETHQGLDHVWPLGAEVLDNAVHINHALCPHVLQCHAQTNESTSATSTITAHTHHGGEKNEHALSHKE